MDPSHLPIQVINSQANANGNCLQNVIVSTRRAYKMVLEKAGLCKRQCIGESRSLQKAINQGIKTSEWIQCLRNPDIHT